MILPDTLTITIHTSIPGHKVIPYQPSMTLPEEKDRAKNVFFQPLARLDSSVKKPSFFFSRSQVPSSTLTLEQATQTGIVDNNIQVTLNTLFPVGGHLYLDNQVYTIGYVGWEKGDWKIEPKTIDSSLFSKPNPKEMADQNFREAETRKVLKEAEEQRQGLPPALLYGNQYEVEKEEQKREIARQPAKKIKESRLTYHIDVDMELKKGDMITKEEMKKINCDQKWNKVKKSYVRLTKRKKGGKCATMVKGTMVKVTKAKKGVKKTRKNHRRVKK
jgi:hypothetical protein